MNTIIKQLIRILKILAALGVGMAIVLCIYAVAQIVFWIVVLGFICGLAYIAYHGFLK